MYALDKEIPARPHASAKKLWKTPVHTRSSTEKRAVVYDANRESAETLARENSESAGALAEVTSSADVIVTVVSDDAAMYEIFATSGDSLLEGSRGKTFVNCARVAPQVHVAIELLAESRGATSIEVCMPSSISRARNGTLSWIDRWRKNIYGALERVPYGESVAPLHRCKPRRHEERTLRQCRP